MYVVIGILIFLFLITVHEFGHFIVAKATGIKVNEFSIGMGPALWKKQGEETLYSLRALPLGGYCAMEGEDESSSDPRSFDEAKPWQRFLTILAGPLMNFVAAIVILFFVGLFAGVPAPVIGQFSEHSALEAGGAQIGDRIVQIDDQKINEFTEITDYLDASNGKEMDVTLLRDGKEIVLHLTPTYEGGRYLLGFLPGSEHSFVKSMGYGFTKTWELTGLIVMSLGMLFTGQVGINDLSGPVGIVSSMSMLAGYGMAAFFTFAAFLSVNLGFFNLLPIPALDGSKLLFIIIEKIRGKKMNKEIEAKITMIGFVLLMGLILVVTAKDIMALF